MLLLSVGRDPHGFGSQKMHENGATLVEFAGIAIVVAVIFAGVIAVAPSRGGDIACSIVSKISEAIGAGGMRCGGGDDKAEEDKHKPTEACTTHQRTQSVKANPERQGVRRRGSRQC